MDTDFNEATAYMFQANNAYIEVPEVTDDIDGDEYTYTEVSNPMPQMNTVELAGRKGTDRSRNGLRGEPVVSQAQETLEELGGYRLGKRGDVGRDDQRDALAEVAIASGIRTITDASSLPNSLPFWIYLPSPEAPQ